MQARSREEQIQASLQANEKSHESLKQALQQRIKWSSEDPASLTRAISAVCMQVREAGASGYALSAFLFDLETKMRTEVDLRNQQTAALRENQLLLDSAQTRSAAL